MTSEQVTEFLAWLDERDDLLMTLLDMYKGNKAMARYVTGTCRELELLADVRAVFTRLAGVPQ